MAYVSDKTTATEYILDPLTEPTPAEETGPGASLRPVTGPVTPPQQKKTAATSRVSPQGTGGSTSTNPFRRSSPRTPPRSAGKDEKSPGVTAHGRQVSNGSARSFPAYTDDAPARRSAEHSRTPSGASTRPRRSSSLRERYPGDSSHRPLDTLTHDNKRANRSPHLRKKHLPGSDTVDKLDDAWLVAYHHEGPYDAASLARNNSYTGSPVAALDESNREALRATPRENINASLVQHRPLQGTAELPPGVPDRLGRVLHYKEGTDLMIEEGNYKRWPGMDYHPDDLKGKGEPSFTIERGIKEQDALAKKHARHSSRGSAADGEFELVERPRVSSGSPPATAGTAAAAGDEDVASSSGAQQQQQPYRDWEEQRRRSGSGTGARIGDGIKRRFGSLRKKDGQAADE